MYALRDVLTSGTLTKDELVRLWPDVVIESLAWCDVSSKILVNNMPVLQSIPDKGGKAEFVRIDKTILQILGVEESS